jgi:hypothetical protein
MNIKFNRKDGYDVKSYEMWLAKHSTRLPHHARHYACAPWHYDIKDHLCPHDAWLERLQLDETGEGSRQEKRSNNGSLTFLGAFHDLKFVLQYDHIHSIEIKRPLNKDDCGFGDWLIDEVILDETGLLVVHEILFSTSASIKIICTDLRHTYKML